jgi:hypothetical protein
MHTNITWFAKLFVRTDQGRNVFTPQGNLGGNAFLYLTIVFFKRGTLNEHKYFLNDYLGSIKTKLKEKSTFKRIFPITLTPLLRKLNFLISMVDFVPSPHFISQVTPMVHTMYIMLTRLLEKCNVEHTHRRYWKPSFYCAMRNNVGVQHTDGRVRSVPDTHVTKYTQTAVNPFLSSTLMYYFSGLSERPGPSTDPKNQGLWSTLAHGGTYCNVSIAVCTSVSEKLKTSEQICCSQDSRLPEWYAV